MCGPVTEGHPTAFLLPALHRPATSSRSNRCHHPRPDMPPKPNKKKFVPLSSVASPKPGVIPSPTLYGSASSAHAVSSGPTPSEAASGEDGAIVRTLAPHPAALRAAELAMNSAQLHEIGAFGVRERRVTCVGWRLPDFEGGLVEGQQLLDVQDHLVRRHFHWR
ncbi:hypothetical protein BC830DRAFT_623884 [Chytriomyces sp. MP71]|nr:hypothetical protein BC830DRAFT_623884 [Chytriomyces sp. MP71]